MQTMMKPLALLALMTGCSGRAFLADEDAAIDAGVTDKKEGGVVLDGGSVADAKPPWARALAVTSDGRVLRFDGSSWSSRPGPNQGPIQRLMVKGYDDLRVVAGKQLFRWDGVSWTLEVDSAPKALTALGGVASEPWLFAATPGGGTGSRFVNGKWELTDFNTSFMYPKGFWGSATDNVWAVGIRSLNNNGVAWRFDGEAWSSVDVPPISQLNSVRGTSPDRVFAVGRSAAIRYDGSSWVKEDTKGAIVEETSSLYVTSSNVWVCARGGMAHRAHDGTWSKVEVKGSMFAIDGKGDKDVWAVGPSGGAVHFDGVTWEVSDTKTQADIMDLWVDPN